MRPAEARRRDPWTRAALAVFAATAVLAACTSEGPGEDAAATTTAATTGPGGGSASYLLDGCTPEPHEQSVARVWDEALLDSIRRDVPAPIVHARNLFHTSAAMWDAWAAYDPVAQGMFLDEDIAVAPGDDVESAREVAISFAAYRVLLDRYSVAAGLQETFDELVATMSSYCLDVGFVGTEGTDPASLGNRVAAAVLAATADDGSLEEQRYIDPSVEVANAPLSVADPTIAMRDPNQWQPLSLSKIVTQNGIELPGTVQRPLGHHWGRVRGFALPPSDDGTPIDPGPPPRLDDPDGGAAFEQGALTVLERSAQLDPADPTTIDISPGALGDNTLGANDGDGHDVNPVTGLPYEPDVVLRADFGRVLAEFWADGPQSETPPGHWNTIANDVSDELAEQPGHEFRVGGTGPAVDRLEWDVKLYLALNGAVHDAAIAAWGLKGRYDSARPISMIRYLGQNGQSSDPSLPSYDPQGLPLQPGLVELATAESLAPGGVHEEAVAYGAVPGQVLVRGWAYPDEPAAEVGGIHWRPAVTWVPYQRPTFVTPAFAGYVSGHSTFSRAAAEVLTGFTGTEYFPGGIHEWTVEPGQLIHEYGPTAPVTLQWATYQDAADQAGLSRIFGGIHVPPDDFEGRKAGYRCGVDAWALAQRYYAGTA